MSGDTARRTSLTASAAVIAFVPFHAVCAQDRQTSDSAAASSEIIVTAQRRAESLQDVPISVTAVSGETLAESGVTATNELMMVVPGLRIEASGAYVQPTIRGISTSVISPTAETNIATYIDGVYQTTQVGAIYELPDVKQVEVLKGPQGTLFGRNATGGAILISTIEPDLQNVEGEVSASYGRFDEVKLKGYVTAPIVEDKVSMMLSAFYENADGYKRHLLKDRRRVGGVETVFVRGKLRFQPWDGADFTLTGFYSDRDDRTAVKNTNYLGNNAARQTLPVSQIASRPWEYSGDEDPFAKSKIRSVSLRGDIEVGPGTLTTTTAYTHATNILTSDSDNSPLVESFIAVPGRAKSFQQELVYATNQLGRVRAVGGLFYYRNSGGQDLDFNRGQLGIFTIEKAESYAAFGEVTFDVSDRLSVTGGIRYSHDNQRAFASILFGTAIRPDTIPKLGEASWNAWTPRLSVLYQVTDRTNVYATYTQGFKSGLFNAVSFQTTPVNPEKVDSYEIGIKSAESNDLSWSLAGFYYDYTDLQQPTIVSTETTPQQELRNAASSEIYGAEFSAAWRVTDRFRLDAGLTYLHARFESYPIAVINVPTGVGGNQQIVADVSGNTLIRSPTWSGNLTASYSVDASFGRIEAAGTIFYSSKFYLEAGNRVVQPDYALLNASLGVRPHGTNAEIRLWGKNLTNQSVLYGSNILANGDSVNHAPPRTYGIEFIYRF